MFTGTLIYLSIGGFLWLVNDKAYLDYDQYEDGEYNIDVFITAAIVTTISMIVLWPLELAAQIFLSLRSGDKK